MEISACITHSFYLILFLTMPKRVIADPEILFQAYNPEYIFFREKDKRRMISFLINSINTFVYGPMGSGKTVLMKSIVREMELRMTYVNSALAQTTNSILKVILSRDLQHMKNCLLRGEFKCNKKFVEEKGLPIFLISSLISLLGDLWGASFANVKYAS